MHDYMQRYGFHLYKFHVDTPLCHIYVKEQHEKLENPAAYHMTDNKGNNTSFTVTVMNFFSHLSLEPLRERSP